MRFHGHNGGDRQVGVVVDLTGEVDGDRVDHLKIPQHHFPFPEAMHMPGTVRNLEKVREWVQQNRPHWLKFAVAAAGVGTAVIVFAVLKRVQGQKEADEQ